MKQETHRISISAQDHHFFQVLEVFGGPNMHFGEERRGGTVSDGSYRPEPQTLHMSWPIRILEHDPVSRPDLPGGDVGHFQKIADHSSLPIALDEERLLIEPCGDGLSCLILMAEIGGDLESPIRDELDLTANQSCACSFPTIPPE